MFSALKTGKVAIKASPCCKCSLYFDNEVIARVLEASLLCNGNLLKRTTMRFGSCCACLLLAISI